MASDTQSSTTREGTYIWTSLVPKKEIVLNRKTSLLDNFTPPESPDERHAVYYEYEENVSASNEQRMYEDDRCTRLLRKQEDPAKDAANIPSDIAEAIASGPQRKTALQVAYAKPFSSHEYSRRMLIDWNAGSSKTANMWPYVP